MSSLERRLTLTAVISISVSSMLGSGIFVLPGVAITVSGPGLWLSYLLAAICVLPAAMSKAELATAMPNSGGTYVYLERTFGPFAGTVAGLGLWLSLLLKSSFALIGIYAYMVTIVNLPLNQTALGLLGAIVLLNILGVGKVSKAVIAVVAVSVTGLSILNFAAIPSIDMDNLVPIAPFGFSSILSGAAMVFVAFAGVTKVAAIAGEIREPEKNLPRGILASLAIVTVLYCCTSAVLAGVINYTELAGDTHPIYSLSREVFGVFASGVTAVIAILTMASMANAGLLAASRFPFAMGRDNLLPEAFGKLNQKFLTPVVSIVASGIVVTLIILLMDVEKIAKLASVFLLIIYMFENIAVIVLRETRVQWYKPKYFSPLYPATQIIGVLLTVFLLSAMGGVVWEAVALIGIPGVLLYFFYSRHKTTRKGVVGLRGGRKDLIGSHTKNDVSVTGNSNSSQPLNTADLSSGMPTSEVLVSLYGNERSPEMLIELGVALDESGEVNVIHLTEVPEQTNLSDVTEGAAQIRSLRRRLNAMAWKLETKIRFSSLLSHDVIESVVGLSSDLTSSTDQKGWLVREWAGRSKRSLSSHSQLGWIEAHLNCNVATFRDAGVRYIRKILIYLRPEELESLAVRCADHLAMVYDADVTISMYVSTSMLNTPEGSADRAAKLETLQKISDKFLSPTSQRILDGSEEVSSVVHATADYDLLITNYRNPKSIRAAIFGSDIDRIVGRSTCSVVVIRASQIGEAVHRSEVISTQVNVEKVSKIE